MRRLALVLLFVVVAAAPRVQAQDRSRVSALGTCLSRAPRLAIVVDGASSTDCAIGGGSSQVLCLCSGGAWAAVGSGGGSTANLPVSFNHPPASAGAYDCEFTSGICSGWSVDTSATAMDAGTVSPTSTASGNPIYDTTTRPGWLLLQSDESAGTVYGVKRASVTLATNATLFFRVNATLRDLSGSEGGMYLWLSNASDANEIVYFGIIPQSNTLKILWSVSNNGSETYSILAWPGDLGYATADAYFAVVKATNDYHFWVYFADLANPTYLGSATKTGVTTLDTIQLWSKTADETPRVISGVDFFRYYATSTFALANP